MRIFRSNVRLNESIEDGKAIAAAMNDNIGQLTKALREEFDELILLDDIEYTSSGAYIVDATFQLASKHNTLLTLITKDNIKIVDDMLMSNGKNVGGKIEFLPIKLEYGAKDNRMTIDTGVRPVFDVDKNKWYLQYR